MKECPLIPGPEKIVVRRDDPDSVTPGGIHLPDTVKEKPCFARILMCGALPLLENGSADQRYREIRSGQRIALTKWAGNIVEVDNEEYAVIGYQDVLAVVRE